MKRNRRQKRGKEKQEGRQEQRNDHCMSGFVEIV